MNRNIFDLRKIRGLAIQQLDKANGRIPARLQFAGAWTIRSDVAEVGSPINVTNVTEARRGRR
jgi:hypothetical protein